MDFALNEDQLELRQAARAWLADRFPLDREWDSTDDRWAELAELGWLDVSEANLFHGARHAFAPSSHEYHACPASVAKNGLRV